MSFLGSLGKTGAFGIGGLVAGSGGDPGKKQLAQILQQYRMLQGQQGNLYANALAMQQKGLGAIQSGYGKALNETSNLGAVAKQNVLDREKQNVGALTSQMAGSGMTGGTLQANLQRGLYRDTNSSLSEIDSTVSQIRSGLMSQLAQAEAGQYGALSGLFQNQNAANVGLGSNLIQTLGSVQHTDPNAWLSSLMQMGGQAGMMGLMKGVV